MNIHPKVQAALREVHEKGLQDGCEHMVVLEPKTLEVAGRSDGTKDQVATPVECRRNDVPWVVIHNHPGPQRYSLSLQDLCCAAQFGGTVAAITDDGMVYAAKPKLDPNSLWIHGALNYAGGMSQHEDNLKMAERGLIEYEWGKLESEGKNGS